MFLSREYRGKKIVVYPAYIDSCLSWREGRRVPKSIAVRNPSVEEIVKAANELGLNPIVEEARYPRVWWKHRYRVVVDKKASKQEILRMIARKIMELRGKK